MQGFREIFETYGADYQATMTRFIGNETMYLRFLDMLFQDPNLQKLGDALESGDLTAAFGAVSYTHLDVYKRQVQFGSSARILRPTSVVVLGLAITLASKVFMTALRNGFCS